MSLEETSWNPSFQGLYSGIASTNTLGLILVWKELAVVAARVRSVLGVVHYELLVCA